MEDFNLKKFLIENKMTRNSRLLSENEDDLNENEKRELSPQEQETVNDILGENHLNEVDLGSVVQKIKEKAKQGLLTAAVVGALLSSPSLRAQQSDIKKVVSTELAVKSRFDQGWENIKSQLSSTNPKLIKSKDFISNVPFESLNWGTAKEGGKKGFIAIAHDKGANIILLDVNSDDSNLNQQLINNAKKAGLNVDKYGRVNVPVDQASKLLQFIKSNVSLL
jgi:hypothetical protein